MSGDAPTSLPSEATRAVIGVLEEAGFFRQIRDLEQMLKRIADDLKHLSDAALRDRGEAERLVAHLRALEAAVAVLARAMPRDVATPWASVRPPRESDSGKKSLP